jgi:hypothetical protein
MIQIFFLRCTCMGTWIMLRVETGPATCQNRTRPGIVWLPPATTQGHFTTADITILTLRSTGGSIGYLLENFQYRHQFE